MDKALRPDGSCDTCGWTFPKLCVCPEGDRYFYKLVSTQQLELLERIRAKVDRVFGSRTMSVSYFPYSHNGEPGPVVYVGFSSHDRIKLCGHKRVLEALDALLDVYVAHPMQGGPWEQSG